MLGSNLRGSARYARRALGAAWCASALAGCEPQVAAPAESASVSQAVAKTTVRGFREELVLSGRNQPTALRFARDGRVFVAEKSGIVWAYESLGTTANPVRVVDLRAAVHNYWDRGLLGLAVHPDFPVVPHVYVLYTLDSFPDGTIPRWGVGGPTPSTSDNCPTPPGPTDDGCVVYGRLSRIVIDPATLVGTEQPLLSGNWCQQYPSHSIGDLAFGDDGYLYATAGDGASFKTPDFGREGDSVNPCDDGAGASIDGAGSEGGSLRSQDLLTPADPTTLDGSLLRIDVSGPTAEAPPDNPLVGNAVPDDDLVVANGLRNPFRITSRPGTGELWVADVGWEGWEELNRVTSITGSVTNFGWPCFEGNAGHRGFAAHPLCQRLYAGDYPDSMSLVAPFYAYSHEKEVVKGDGCGTGNAAITGVAFQTGTLYPAEFEDALFFADSARRCVWAMLAGPDGHPDPFRRALLLHGTAGRVVDLQMGPDGTLHYVDLDGGKVYRIAYYGRNRPPRAVLLASPTSGPLPLHVTLDASGSSDAENGSALEFAWDLDGDGDFDDASGALVSHTYTLPGSHVAGVRVRDMDGVDGFASVTLVAGDSAPEPVIEAPAPSLRWRVGQTIAFSGHATDAQDGRLPAGHLDWTLILHHCATAEDCHEHPITTFEGVDSGRFVAPDHEYPTFLELRLTATDLSQAPLSASAGIVIQPRTAALQIQTIPPGLEIVLGSDSRIAPFTHTLVNGSTTSVAAPPAQVVNGVAYAFDSWSDGGAATHAITPKATSTTLTARYLAAP